MGWGRAGCVAALVLASVAGASAYAQVRQYPDVKLSPCWQTVIESKSVSFGPRTGERAFPFAGVRRDPSVGMARIGCEAVAFYRQFDARGSPYPRVKADHVFSLEMESNVGTPLSAWTDAMLEAIEPCWTEAAPEFR